MTEQTTPKTTPVRFRFEGLGEYDGHRYDGEWNGFPIIGVTPDVARRILGDMVMDAYTTTLKQHDLTPAAEDLRGGDDEAASDFTAYCLDNLPDLARIVAMNEVGTDGLLALDGFTPEVVE